MYERTFLFGTDYFERCSRLFYIFFSLSFHMGSVYYLPKFAGGMKDKRCVFFCFFSRGKVLFCRFDLVPSGTRQIYGRRADAQTLSPCDFLPLYLLILFFFFSRLAFIPKSLLSGGAKKNRDDTLGPSPNCHHPIAVCNDAEDRDARVLCLFCPLIFLSLFDWLPFFSLRKISLR